MLTTFIVVALLYSEGRDRPDLFAQVTNLLNATRAMIVVGVILPVSVSGMLNTAPNTGTYVRVVIGLGLAIAILWNLSEPETKQRKDIRVLTSALCTAVAVPAAHERRRVPGYPRR